MAKLPANLSVDPAVMERAKAYGRLHGTSVSQLAGDFLASLVTDDEAAAFSPIVTMLYGAASRSADDASAVGSPDAIEAYRAHLERKYRQQE